MRALPIALALTIGAAATTSVSAETLSLEQAQAEARAHAPEILQIEAAYRGSIAIARDARRVLRNDPVLSGSATKGDQGERGWEGGIEWRLDSPVAWSARRAAANAGEDRAGQDRADALLALDEAVAIAFADLASAQRGCGGAERLESLQSVVAEAAHRELDAGEGNQLEVDAADLDLVAAQSAVLDAQRQRRAAQIALARLMHHGHYENLTVEEAPGHVSPPTMDALETLVSADPRVKSADAELRLALAEAKLNDRLLWPAPTFGVSTGRSSHDIPPDGFYGGPPGLSANWADHELTFSVSFAIPLIDRRREERTRSVARIWAADAALRSAKAEALAELTTAADDLGSTVAAYEILAATSEIIDREYRLLDQAIRAGAISAVERAQDTRRLVESAQRLDEATHAMRIAEARWARWSHVAVQPTSLNESKTEPAHP